MATERTNTIEMRTPEGVSFSFELASPVLRGMAYLIDGFVISLSSSLILMLLTPLAIVSVGLLMALHVLAPFVISIGYGILLEWRWRGQTVGKRVMGLRVMDEQGLRLQFSQIALRNLARFIDVLPALYGLGGTVCLLSRRSQRLGDLAARTIVVRIPRISEPSLEQLMAGHYNSLRAHAHLAARLRQRLSPAEAGIALQALLRRDALDPVARVSLFEEIAERFRSLVQFPQEATEGLSDEHYVRNVVDIAFRRRT